MRLPDLSRDSWELCSGEEAHAEHPQTFWIPDREARERLRPGQAVKLIFDIEAADASGVVRQGRERMWVIVSRALNGQYIGILDSEPASLAPADDVYLVPGAEIPFGPEHVIDIAAPPPEYSQARLREPPKRR